MTDIYNIARQLGDVLAHARTALPDLGLAVAKAAVAGKINEGNARDVYGEYIVNASGEQPDPTSNTFKANASKLRTIIKCSIATPDMLEKMASDPRADGAQLYEKMVAACRRRLNGKGG
jgi:hypothetical protein